MPRRKYITSEPYDAQFVRPPVDTVSKLLHEAPPFHRSGALWRSAISEAEIQRGSLNIVCGGSREHVIGQSLNLAREICRTETREKSPWPFNPEEVTRRQKVLYINTCSSQDHITNQLMGLWPGAQEWSVRRDKYVRPSPAADDTLDIFTVPAGQFVAYLEQIQKHVRDTMASVVILNSFDIACRTARHRDDLTFALFALRDLGCTVIVFTQEEKRKAEKQARGPLALLRMQCDQMFDHSIFGELVYVEPLGSTHPDESSYWKSTGQTGAEYLRQLDELIAARDAKKNREVAERRELLPNRVMAEEIIDTIDDDIELPNDLVEGGIYNMDGELVMTGEPMTLESRNTYTVMQNHFEPLTK